MTILERARTLTGELEDPKAKAALEALCSAVEDLNRRVASPVTTEETKTVRRKRTTSTKRPWWAEPVG